MAGQELVAAGDGALVITTRQEFHHNVQRWQQQQCHVLTPAADFGALPDQWVIIPSLVYLSPDENAGDVYRDKLFKQEEVAITKDGLRKIERAGGISHTTEDLSDPRIPYLWKVRATIEYRGFDGMMKHAQATEEFDLRDGAPRAKEFRGDNARAALDRARIKGLRACEARAINAAIREFGIRQKYRRGDFAKPFVVFNLVFRPDMSDPVQREMATRHALEGRSALYAGGQGAAPAPRVLESFRAGEADPEGEPRATTTSESPAATGGTARAAAAPVIDGTLRYRVISVQKQPRQDRDPIYYIETDPAQRFLTEDLAMATAAKEAKEGGAYVEIDAERTAEGLRVLELRRVVETSAQAADGVLGDARYVTDIKTHSGTSKGRDWTRYAIHFGAGEVGSTFSESIFKTAEEAMRGRLPVRATLTPSDRYPDQLDLTDLSIIDTRQGVLPMASEL